VINVETENAKLEETLPKEPQHQTTEEVKDVEDANVVVEATIAKTAVEAEEAKTCDLCDKTFGTLKGLRAHIGSQHKGIPQVDGSSDVVNEPTYCRVCKECPDEIKTSEDINFHVMNDHEVMAVIENYGKEWASERQYCIRRWSPFEKYFKTP
jgi:protein-arginine kinase activator protein McsA